MIMMYWSGSQTWEFAIRNLKALTLLGSIGGTGAFTDAIDFISRNSDYVRQLITHKVSVENLDQAFELRRNVDRAMKVLLEF